MSATTSSTTPPPSTPSPSATSATTSPDLPPAPWPPGLREAYRAYELALAANDLPALANAFGEYGVRVDPSGMAAGAEAVAAFRSARNGGRMRIVERVEVREVAPGVVLTASATRTLAGEAGFHTQVWRSSGGIWRIAAAHVTPPAAALDRRIWRVAGSPLAPATSPGPLDGVRVAVKDVFAVAGVCRGLGNPVVAAEAAPQPVDAAAVAALRAIGAEVTGVATTDEFAYSLAGVNAHTGAPPNLAAPGHLPGGSSSGPAAAVALGQADLGLGTDTAGSIRVPASYQGLWGLRTTLGTVDASGLAPLAPSFDTVGWLTRDVSLLRRVVGELLPHPPRALPRRALVPAGIDALLTPGAAVSFAGALERLLAAGVLDAVDRIDLAPAGPSLEELREVFRIVQGSEAWALHGEWVEAHPGGLGTDVAARFSTARDVEPSQVARARQLLDRHRRWLRELTGDAVVILPATPGGAPRMDADLGPVRTATIAMTSLASVGGLPALSAPLLRDGPLPLGLSLVGAPGDDAALVELGAACAAALPA
ncbi:AtzH-like domain-containing protein [Salana multivorans]